MLSLLDPNCVETRKNVCHSLRQGDRHFSLDSLTTVKAPNFGPHVNFDLFPEGLTIVKTRPTKQNEEKWKLLKIFKFANSVLFIFGACFLERSYRTCKERLKVSMRSKVRGFYGNVQANFYILVRRLPVVYRSYIIDEYRWWGSLWWELISTGYFTARRIGYTHFPAGRSWSPGFSSDKSASECRKPGRSDNGSRPNGSCR